MRQTKTVAVTMIKILISYAERFQADSRAALAYARIDPEMLGQSDARVPVKAFTAMWQHIAAAVDDPYPGLNFGRELSRHYPAGSIVFTMMLNCETMGRALEIFVRYHRIMGDNIQPVLVKDEQQVSLSWQALDLNFKTTPHLSEALLSVFFTIIKTLSRDRVTPVKICFTHHGPPDISEYQRLFKTRVVFGAPENELIIKPGDLDTFISLANPALFKMLDKYAARMAERLASNQLWSDRVLHLLSDMIVSGIYPTLDHIAKNLALSKRSLQEKLKKEKTGFRHLLEQVRRQTAIDNLQNLGMPICDVAFLLGYSDQSAFNHAFKRWTGQTPRNFRKQATTQIRTSA